nr:metallophosphoesterase [uncultured Holophaga sp.]
MFAILLLLGIGLQILHWRALKRILPSHWGRPLAWLILLAHTPLLIYLLLRVTGASAVGSALWLRTLARAGFYILALSGLNLIILSLESLVWRVRKHRGKEVDRDRRAFLQKGAAVSLGVLAVASVRGYQEGQDTPLIRRNELRFPDLPTAFDGLRIAHLSDLHSGPFINLGHLRLWRGMAEREKPDMLIITGDFVDAMPAEALPFAEAFRNFQAPLGRFAILGNHDYFTDPRPIWKELQDLGFTLLENTHTQVERGGERLILFGLQDPMARDGRFRGLRFGPGPMPQDVALGMPKEGWRLGLVHRPSNWDLALEAGARLTLSGHTHGGQINLLPGLSSARLLGRYIRGLYTEGPHWMNVSAGLGMVALPVRLGAPPEFSILTLRRG